MTAQLTPDKTFPTKTVVPGSWFTDLQTDRKTIARCFYDEATPDLPLAEQKKGTTWGDPTVGVLRYFRIDGAGDPRVSSPLRSMWIPSDQSPAGPPPLDGRVKDGDSYLADDGTDSYVAYYSTTLARFWARGILAEYRTEATSGVPAQPSGPILIRSSEWVSGAAKWRQVRMRYVQGALQFLYETEEGASHLAFTLYHGSSSTFELWGNPTGNVVPGLKYSRDRTGSSPGQISCTFSTEQTDIDGTAVWFHHGDNTRFARHRFRGSDAGALGADAEVLSASYRLPATALATTRNSASVGYVGNYWDGAVGVEAISYAQLILTATDPAGYLRHGFDFGPGTLDLYHYGRLALAGTTVLAGDVAAGNAGAFTSTPTYSGAHAVTTHALLEFNGPTLSGGATLGDAVLARYDADPGTHKGLDAAAGGADAWEKRETPAGLLYAPTFTSKAVAATRIGSSAVALYAKTLSGGAVSWDVAGDGFASVAGVVATVKSTGGGGGGGGPQVVADASDPQALAGVGGTEDYALALVDGGGIGIAVFFPSSMTLADLGTALGFPPEAAAFCSNDGSFTSSPGPVFVNGGAGNDYTWDNTPLDDSTVGSISTSPGNPTLEWNGSAYEATYAEWTLGATTYENTATGGPPTVDSYFFLAAGGGGGGGGGIPALGWSVDGTTVTVTDGSGSSGDDVSVVVWGTPA